MTKNTKINQLGKQLEQLAFEARELYLDKTVRVLTKPPTPLVFYREYVSPNKPVLIQGAIDHWPAISRWNHDYLRNIIGDLEVTVAVTPNGYADAVTNGKFVMPHEKMMKVKEFLKVIENPDEFKDVYYIQKQNSNLTDEFATLLKDVDSGISWGTEAFGKEPDAVNFWMGDSRAVTSMHKDHYENLYCVVKGWKKFILIPPTDQPFVPYELYDPAVYVQNGNGSFTIKPTDSSDKVPWIAIDPLNPDLALHPEYQKASPIEVTVNEGEMLYLPSLWFHHVQQSHGCVAVNYWYDMEFDIKYNYYNFVKNVTEILKG
ncbi:bifunctional peptidase and (3S)-lysyl hydroxylase Jmjd7-like [Mytilus galloprovincialis]|uniref:bifunctional peptidase and (3S)-lysyl hydroxylase Jmjd7-like n=1 Tax=Mytilus galloprovincialis TaxID=29158 RepID=UPI003F7CC903